MINQKSSISYIAPPKLYKQFMLAGLTVPEMGILLLLFFSQLLTGNYIYAFFCPATFAVFVTRIFDGKSLKDMLIVLIRYHTQAQQFTRHGTSNTKKTRRNRS